MAMVPTIEEAQAVLDGSVRRGYLSSSREVYLALDSGWVYKFDVEGDDMWCPNEQNRVEWDSYLFIRDNMHLLPEGTAIPELVLLEDEGFVGGCVLASRHVEGVEEVPRCRHTFGRGGHHCFCPDEFECWWERMGYCTGDESDRLIGDLEGNVFYDKDNTYWILDLGYGSDRLKQVSAERTVAAR